MLYTSGQVSCPAALTLSEGLRDTARQERHFAGLRDLREFCMLVPPAQDEGATAAG